MRRWCLIGTFAAALAATAGLSAQKQGQLFISLMSADGKPVEGLAEGDVTISEDNVTCKTVKVEAANWPTKLQVLVDNGRSNTNPINPLRDGLTEFFAQIPDGVEMSLYATASTPRAIVKPTTDRQKLIAGIGLLGSDGGAGMFFDALSEAAERIEKDKTPNFPIVVMVGSDFGNVRVLDRDYQKLQDTVINHGVTTHVVVTVGGHGGATSGGTQVEIGLNLTKLSGGRFENIGSSTRLATLLPEIAKLVAESVARQSHQYRVTYERPAKPSAAPSIGATIRRDGVVRISLHGNQ
jgi:hypothetical protein